MSRGAWKRRAATVALFATLVLRASMPDGYMPASAGSGLLYELCPSGVPAQFMAALSGADSSSHHHHHNHSGDEDSATAFDSSHCTIGHLLSTAAAVSVQPVEPALLPDSISPAGPPVTAFPNRDRRAHRSRAPPA
jgi:hypothetical protein